MKTKLLLVLLTLLSYNLFAQADHLLLTEAVLTPTDGEYIEIANFSGAQVDLTNYYLSDDQDYHLFPGLFGNGPGADIGSSDFLVQFPSGSVIDNGQVITIAFDGAGFFTNYSVAADFEIKGTDDSVTDMISHSSSTSSGLTNSGENVVLFYWDGVADLVQDVDMVILGTPSSSNMIANKTGVSVDGPDADTDASTYLADAFTMVEQATDPGFGFSTKRILFEDGETATAGNGISGHDETSEDITVTWDSEYTAPDPGLTSLSSIPVELTSFAANVVNNSVVLNWATATETNNSGFEVQVQEGENWTKLGFVDGFGTTTEVQTYSFTVTPEAAGVFYYRLKQIDFDGTSELSDVIEVNFAAPVAYELSQNYPNPFNPETTIRFAIPENVKVKVEIHNILGQLVAELVNENLEAGIHTVNFDASNLNSGVYFYSVTTDNFHQVRKMTLLK